MNFIATVVLRIHRCTSALRWSTNDVVNMVAVYHFLWYIFILLKTINLQRYIPQPHLRHEVGQDLCGALQTMCPQVTH